MNRFRLSPLAELDLGEIWLYVAQDSGVGRADGLIDQIARRCGLLAAHPSVGRLRDDIASGVRSFPVKTYMASKGCLEVRQDGSHLRIQCGRCTTTVPVHAGEDLGPGLLRKIERDLEPCLSKGWLKGS